MDHQALTVLIPLTSGRGGAGDEEDEQRGEQRGEQRSEQRSEQHGEQRGEQQEQEWSFTGGGTAFWAPDARGPRVEGATIVMRPAAGSAMLFGGKVNHAGVPVESGQRVVFVASFSRRASGGREQRARDAQGARDIYGDYV
jgi:hypothetical protein